jgi:hypothetical protein
MQRTNFEKPYLEKSIREAPEWGQSTHNLSKKLKAYLHQGSHGHLAAHRKIDPGRKGTLTDH